MLTGQFNLGLAAIHEIARSVSAETDDDGRGFVDRLWDACLVHTRPRLDTLAQRLTPKAVWADIVLPDDALDLLKQIADQVRQRGTVYEDWGFRQRMNRGRKQAAHRPPEPGSQEKTVAHVPATQLPAPIFCVYQSANTLRYYKI